MRHALLDQAKTSKAALSCEGALGAKRGSACGRVELLSFLRQGHDRKIPKNHQECDAFKDSNEEAWRGQCVRFGTRTLFGPEDILALQDDEIWQGGFWKRQSMAMEPSRPDDGQMFLGQSVVDFRSPHRQNGPLNPRSSSFSHACCAQLVGFSHEQEV